MRPSGFPVRTRLVGFLAAVTMAVEAMSGRRLHRPGRGKGRPQRAISMEGAGPEDHGICAWNNDVHGRLAEGGRLKAPRRKPASGNPLDLAWNGEYGKAQPRGLGQEMFTRMLQVTRPL